MNNLSSKTKIGKLFNPYASEKPEKESEQNGKGSGSKKKIEEEKGFVFSLSQFQQKNRSSRGTNNNKVQNNPNSSIQRQKQASNELQEEQSKRKMIYGSESYKQKYQEDFPKAVKNNNDLFSMVFLGKVKQNQTASTTNQTGFNKGKPLSSSKLESPPPTFYESGSIKVTDFELGRKLGAGKFGEVFIARHKVTGFVCALKKIDKANVDSQLVVQLVREIKIQSFLSHPNIVKMFSFFADKNYIYLVLQLCFSGQLYNFLKKKRKMPEDMTRNIVQQICRALDYMHENQIIHRDLKPENVIYHCGLLKLCDFGWSISTNTMRGTFCGTPLYVSPELLKRKTYNNKIDVWSIGILTYQLLFGRVPFQITTEQDFMKIVQDEIKFSKATKISEQAKEFILICLEKDPRDRFSLPELLQHPFLTHVENVSMVEMY